MKKFDSTHPLVLKAKTTVTNIIDDIEPALLSEMVKKTPSLRGIVAGNIAELRFRQYVESFKEFSNFYKPDDHDRSENKVDLRFDYKGKSISFQLKSIQTNSIKWNVETNTLECGVQNDGSDKRTILLPNGHYIETTNYKYGDYDILAVPLYPFLGKWEFAYILNSECTQCTAKKYSDCDKRYLIATMEKLSFPLKGKWTSDIMEIIHRHLTFNGITC